MTYLDSSPIIEKRLRRASDPNVEEQRKAVERKKKEEEWAAAEKRKKEEQKAAAEKRKKEEEKAAAEKKKEEEKAAAEKKKEAEDEDEEEAKLQDLQPALRDALMQFWSSTYTTKQLATAIQDTVELGTTKLPLKKVDRLVVLVDYHIATIMTFLHTPAPDLEMMQSYIADPKTVVLPHSLAESFKSL